MKKYSSNDIVSGDNDWRFKSRRPSMIDVKYRDNRMSLGALSGLIGKSEHRKKETQSLISPRSAVTSEDRLTS